jgi:hypothetical protein
MSRRKSKEDKKVERIKKKDDRKLGIKKELNRVIIACQGTKTEVHYFKAFFHALIQNKNISKSSFVIAKHSHTDPIGVLTDLQVALKKDSEFEHQWIVIDRDEHESFANALYQAKSINVNVAYSNPSFELWYLLHFEDFNSSIHRHDLPTRLQKYLHYSKNATTLYQETLSLQPLAIERAKNLISNHSQERALNPSIDNPSTTVYELVEVLNGLGD